MWPNHSSCRRKWRSPSSTPGDQIFVGHDGLLAAALQSDRERRLGLAVHRRGVDDPGPGFERRADDLARELGVAAEGVPGAEADHRPEAALFHHAATFRRARRPAANAAAKNHGSWSGPRPI